MKPRLVCFFLMLSIFLPKIESFNERYIHLQMGLIEQSTGMNSDDSALERDDKEKQKCNVDRKGCTDENLEFSIAEFEKMEDCITPMEALEIVKEQYAANFVKTYQSTGDEYYYKLPIADYYLVYEGEIGQEPQYLYHLYEFVIDEPETGIGHTVTYGWYTVDKITGYVSEQVE